MKGRTALLTGLVLVVAAGSAPAAETLEAHSHGNPKVIVLDNKDVRPSTLTMGTADLLVFENHSLHPIEITFTDPKDLEEHVRCQLVRHKVTAKSEAPWLLFTWNNGKLSATVPPGRFASICSLQPGSYTFLAARQTAQLLSEGRGGGLPEKGQVVVQ